MQPTAPGFPRILFVNPDEPDSLGLADLVRQLLLDYPAERIHWWCCRSSKHSCPSGPRVARVHRAGLPRKLEPQRKWTFAKCLLMERIWVPLAARHLRRTIVAARPDLIWILVFGWPILVAHQALQRRHLPRVHTSLWDLPDHHGSRRILGESRSRRFAKAAFHLVGRANSYDGVSPAMLEEISLRTGKNNGLLVHSGFEPQHLRALESTSPGATPDDAIRLAYVGTIISANAFHRLLSGLESIRRTSPRPIVLEFYGARDYRRQPWFKPQWMIEHGTFSDQALVESLQRCSWGLVVMDPEGTDLRYSRFSFPNKIGTYLSAGVPILGYGHEQSSLAELMRGYSVGTFTSTDNPRALEKFLSESLHIPQPRSQFRKPILHCARTEFNAAEIRDRLWKAWGVGAA